MNLRVLMLTSEWPTPEKPNIAPFIVRQAEYLRFAGIAVDVLPFRGHGNPFRYIRTWVDLQKRLSNNKYDLIHAQFGQSGLLAILPKRLPLVVTFRGSDVLGIVGNNHRYMLSGRILSLISKLVAKQADECIVVSKKLIESLPLKNYHIIPSGLDLSLVKPIPMGQARTQLGLEQDKHLILFSGLQSDPRKRYDLASDVVELVRRKFPDICLVTLKSIPHSQVPCYLNACDALLSTSMHEGSPNLVKEALACNLPVVSTDVGDVRERIENIEGCEVCQDDRPETIAAALVRVLARGQRIHGRQAVLELDEKLLTQKVIQVYHRAIKKKEQK